MNQADNNTETLMVMYKTQNNGPWHSFQTQISPETLAKYKRLKKKEAKALLTKMIEPSVLGQEIIDVDYKW